MIDLADFKDIVYKDRGRVYPEFDCYGFVKFLYKKIHGVDIVDFEYDKSDDRKNEDLYYDSLLNPIWTECPPKKGVIAVFRVNGYISHVGFMLDNKRFVHIMDKSGVRINNIISNNWKNRFIGSYKYA